MYLQIKKASMALFLSLICISAYGQKKLSGTVLDANGDPIIGATVNVDGKNGAITDLDGAFKLDNVKSSSRITVSYVGYKPQTLTVGERSVLDVKLQEDNEQLDEVVVVGYGTMKKSDLTGSVSSVSTEELNAKGAASVMGNLQGANPGVNISQTAGRAGDSFNIEIRGKSSINSNTTPLFVVDGVMCDDINFLNPQDIERIDVLKDASSTAIYGSRATAGVIIVTTKGGAGVDKEKKPTISYDGYYGWSAVARMPEFQDAKEFYDYRFMKFLTYAGKESAQPTYQLSGVNMEQGLLRQHTGSGDYMMKSMLASGRSYNWPELVTQNGSQQNHYLAVSGGSKLATYHFGLGYNKEEGTYIGDSQERINFKGSVDAKINKIISGGFSVNVARTENDYANDDAIKYAYRMNPFMVPYDENGNINHKPGAYTALGTDSYQFSDQLSTLDVMKSTNKKRETWRLLGNFYLKFDLMKGLDFKTTFSPSYTNYRTGFFGGYVNPVTGQAYDDGTYADANSDGIVDNEANLTVSRSFSWTWDNIINYNFKLGKDHSFNFMGLYSMESGNTKQEYWAANNVMAGTDWWNLNTGTFNADDSKNSYTESSMQSYALRLNYDYMNRYLLTGTIRWDGSSKFPDGSRWGSFPSAAFAWRVTEEPFMEKNKNWLSNLKVRLSYGVTGNNKGIGNYDTMQTAAGPIFYPYGTQYQQGFYPSSIVNTILMWEKSHEFNGGIDFGFLNGRITGTVDLYTKKSTELLYDVQLPLVSGGGTMTTNVGSVRNNGIEVSLTTVNISKKDLNWTTTFNFAHNKNEILEINGTGNQVSGSDITTQTLRVGSSVNSIYAWETGCIVSDRNMTVPDNNAAKNAGLTPGSTMRECDYYYKVYGLTEGQPYIKDINGDGVINDDDRVMKSADPTWTGSINSNLTWKNWDFGFNIYIKANALAYSNFLGEYLNFSDRGRMKLNADYYIPAGTLIDVDGINADGTYINPVYQETTHYGSYPFPNNGGTSSGLGSHATYWNVAKCVTTASYLKVKNITLGYTFPKAWINKFGCSHLRLYFTVTNPFVFTDYKGFDPEWAGASLKNDGPSTITYQLGASVKF